MGRFAVLALAGAAIALLIPTQADSFTYGRLVGGQVRTTLVYGSGMSPPVALLNVILACPSSE